LNPIISGQFLSVVTPQWKNA